MIDGIEPISDDELLYRRVPESMGWFDPESRVLMPQAFDPHKTNDTTGISVSRAKYTSIEKAAQGQPNKSYFVAVLRAGDLRKKGIEILPNPLPNTDDVGQAHAEIPNLTASNRKTTEALQIMRMLANELCLRVEGPFPSN